MKVLNPDSGFLAYQKVFKQLRAAKSPMVVWQVFPENGKRVINDTTLISFDLDLQIMKMASVNDFIDPALPLYLYSEDQKIIFKSNVRDIKDDCITAVFPNEIKVLDFSDHELIKQNTGLDLKGMWKTRTRTMPSSGPPNWEMKSMAERSNRDQEFLNTEFDHMSMDEEEKLFADKRESPRVRPNIQKLVKVIRKGETQANYFDLFDLSRGGMAFITSIPEQYPKGCDILITGFDTFDLDDPLFGMVMGHRPLDDSQFDVKIGIKFNDGQA